MKLFASVVGFLLFLCGNAQNQGFIPPEDYFVIEGDTVINSSIELKEVILFQPLRFSNYDEAKRYVILRERTHKVYPYAKMAADRLNVLSERLNKIKSKINKMKMSKSTSMICALITTFIWGTAFIAQDTGMDNIGPLTFNFSRFFVGFITILPIALFFERKKILVEISSNSKVFYKYLLFMGISLFLGTYLQQASLQYTNIANAAFFTVFYVPIVPILLFFIYSKKVHWSIWPAIGLCILGVYLLSDFSNSEIMLGDGLVILCSVFWALHIIFAGKFMEEFDIPMFYAALQALFVATLSLIFSFIFEEINISKILMESSSILYAGALSGGIAFTLQMYAQKNIEEAPAAIIYSLEGVFAAVAGWIILNQFLSTNNMIGCLLILIAVISSQISPSSKN